MARPIEYSQEVVTAAWAYIENYSDHGHVIPSVVGLCQVINRSKSTIYEWAKDPAKGFSDIVEAIAEAQEQKLVSNGLTGVFNSTITKLLLTKHGYHDKQDSTIAGPNGGAVEMQWTIQPVKPVNEAHADN